MRLIDADELIKVFEERLWIGQGDGGAKERWAHMEWLRSLNAIKAAPTIDAVEVVRCKDCKHWSEHDNFLKGSYTCGVRESYGFTYSANDFCNYGERR